jgi:hypothetical protein
MPPAFCGCYHCHALGPQVGPASPWVSVPGRVGQSAACCPNGIPAVDAFIVAPLLIALMPIDPAVTCSCLYVDLHDEFQDLGVTHTHTKHYSHTAVHAMQLDIALQS